MPRYAAPGVYVEEVAGGARSISATGTSTAGFVGTAPDPRARPDAECKPHLQRDRLERDLRCTIPSR